MTTIYEVHGQRFPTRRALAAYCAGMIARGELSAADEAFVRELVTGHPRAKQIIGRGVRRIVVGLNGFNDPCFIAERVDGTRATFSHVSCITAKFALEAA